MTFSDTAHGGHDLTGSAIAALKPVLINERLLHRMQRAVRGGESFDGVDTFALC
jgi:hypothetical protein